MKRSAIGGLMVAALLACAGCTLPGKPGPGVEVPRPDQVLDSTVLYQHNCAGCHGADGKNGAAMSLGDPVYLAIVDDDTLRDDHLEGATRYCDVGICAERGRHADGPADRRDHSRHSPALGQAECADGHLGSALCREDARKPTAGADRIRNLLRVMSWRGRQERSQGRLGHEPFLSEPDQRSRIANHRHYRPTRLRSARLEG